MNASFRFRRLATLSMFALAAACSSASSSVAPASASIGPTGGTVATSDGASVVIPAGALSKTITVGVAKISAPMALPSGITAASSAYEFTPEGQVFSKSVTITLPTSTSTGLVFYTSETGGSWTAVADAVPGTGSISAEMMHFSDDQAGTTSSGGTGSSGGPGLCVLQTTPTSTCNQSTLACPQPLLPGGVSGACPAASLLGCCVLMTEATCYYTAEGVSVGMPLCPGLGGTWQGTLP